MNNNRERRSPLLHRAGGGLMVWACDHPDCSEVMSVPYTPQAAEIFRRAGWTESIDPGDVFWERECYCPRHSREVRRERDNV
jgi:hypothetical protein